MAWLDTLTAWLAAHPHWLGLAVFLLAFGECLAIVGLLIPGTVLLFAVAVLAGNGALPLWETLLLGFVGGMLGDLCSYALGRRFHQNIRGLPVLRDHPQWLASAEQHFERYGVISLLAGRFIGPLRPMLPMVAGMLDMPFGRFTAVSLLAGSGWAVAYLLPGWATGAALRLPLPADFWQNAALPKAWARDEHVVRALDLDELAVRVVATDPLLAALALVRLPGALVLQLCLVDDAHRQRAVLVGDVLRRRPVLAQLLAQRLVLLLEIRHLLHELLHFPGAVVTHD